MLQRENSKMNADDEAGRTAISPYDFSRPPYKTHASMEFSGLNLSDNYLKGCKWAPDGSCIMTNSADSTLHIFNAPDLSELPDLPLGWNSVLRVKEVDLVYDYCWYPKMSSLDSATSCFLSTARTSPIHLWDAFTGGLRASYIPKNHADAVIAAYSVAVDPSGELIYAGFSNALRIFDISRPGEECDVIDVSIKNGHQGGIISCIAFDSSGVDLVALGSYNRSIGICATDGEIISILNGHKSGVTHLRFSADGRRLYSGARLDNSIFCWDLRTNKVLHNFHRPVHTNQRVYFDINGGENCLISGLFDGQLGIWGLKELAETGEGIPLPPNFVFPVHEDMVNGVSFHPTWPVLCTASGQKHVPNIESEPAEDSENDCCGRERICVDNTLKLWYIG